MAIEHRLHPREPAAYQATVRYPPLGLVLAKVRDVSPDGMSIDTTPITLNLNTPVNVTIRFREKGQERISRFGAVVVWAQDGRAGLMLRSVDETHSGVLQGLVQAFRRAS
jgi:hypothetical protein